jgi:anaerobic selenocysteine-containing dehydrogenase
MKKKIAILPGDGIGPEIIDEAVKVLQCLQADFGFAAELEESEWIPIRPGSDGALALGLAHILIRDELYDAEFVEKWTLGFDEFAAYVKDFTPEYVSKVTGIEENTIELLAERIADAEGATYIMYTGLEYTKSGVQNIRAVMVLWALAEMRSQV